MAIALSPAWLHAQEVRLFDADGKQVANYDELIDPKNLHYGDVLVFSDGARFEFQSIMNHGNTTLILEVVSKDTPPFRTPMALRIPLKSGDFQSVSGRKAPFTSFIDSTIQGRPALEEEGLPIPKLYRQQAGQYIALEKVAADFDLDDLLARPEEILEKYRSLEILEEAEAALYKFGKQAAKFHTIGDFSAGQLTYSIERKQWYLLDWTKDHQRAKWYVTRYDLHLFDKYFGIFTSPPSDASRKTRILERLRAIQDHQLRQRRRLGCIVELVEDTFGRIRKP
ncbi:MAG: hypothetical protein AB7P04_00110 [Bacteriovoracia bacterium]